MAAVRPKEGGKAVHRGKAGRHNASQSKPPQSEAHDVPSGSGSKLPKPLSPKSRRNLTEKTSKLIRKRNELDRALLVQAFRALDQLNANDWLPREELLRQCERMASRERDYIRTRTKELDERTAFYSEDPSEERALDIDLIRTQLWKFKRHLGPYLEAAEEPPVDDQEEDVSSSDSNSDTRDDEAETVQGKINGSAPSQSAETNAADAQADESDPSVGLDGAFDDVRHSRKRKSSDLDSRKESPKKARKEQASGSSKSTTPQNQSAKTGPPTRSKEMENSLDQIYTSMSQPKSSQVSVNGDSKVKIEEAPVKTILRDVSEDAERKAPKTSASSSSNSIGNSISDGAVRPFYQRHAKAMMRPDFDDLVYDRPQHRRGPKSKQKRSRAYLVSGALPVPHLPSPTPDKPKARSASTDGP